MLWLNYNNYFLENQFYTIKLLGIVFNLKYYYIDLGIPNQNYYFYLYI